MPDTSVGKTYWEKDIGNAPASLPTIHDASPVFVLQLPPPFAYIL